MASPGASRRPFSARTLDAWLHRIEGLHPAEIAPGLERAGRVWTALGGRRPAPLLVSVAGTNGKGSCVAVLEALARAAGLHAAAYTSPHLLCFNERIRIDGRPADDAELIAAFEEVEAARGDTLLTFFEFTTLAAFRLLAGWNAEIAFLEVGMGGRLDAVNLLHPDAAIVTSIDLDHCEWIGRDRESIGFEKASIFRDKAYAICSDEAPPESVRRLARPARALFAGEDFHWSREPGGGWSWRGADAKGRTLEYTGLPRPRLAEESAAAALQAWHCLGQPAARPVLAAGLAAELSGRRERRCAQGQQFILDGAHNPAAASHLARWLAEETGPGRIPAVCAMLEDKDCEGFVQALKGVAGPWYVTQAAGQPRALPAPALAAAICEQGCEVRAVCTCVEEAIERASSEAAGRAVLVTGSLFTVADALRSMEGLPEGGRSA